MNRRRMLVAFAGAGIGTALPLASARAATRPRVLIAGGGFAGATAAKYLRLWSKATVDVTLVEPKRRLVSCPFSNRVVAGLQDLESLTRGYQALDRRYGVRVVHERVVGVDVARRELRLAGGERVAGQRMVLAPGIDFLWESLPGLASATARTGLLHAWKAGPQTTELARRVAALPPGGSAVITVPRLPYRCPPGPYERASLIAGYFAQFNPRAKLLVLDANPEVRPKGALFRKAWAELYPGIIDYHPDVRVLDLDTRSDSLILDTGELRPDLLNVIPEQRAGDLALNAGLPLADGRWIKVDWRTMEAAGAPGVHVIGDAVLTAPGMPKSAHMANQHAKIAVAAILRSLAGEEPDPESVASNTCYSFVAADAAIRVSSIHRYDAAQRVLLPVPGSGGVSVARNRLEADYARNWLINLWNDTLG
jgi:sulfite dehydrogenase